MVEVQTLQLADAPEPGEDLSLGPLDVCFYRVFTGVVPKTSLCRGFSVAVQEKPVGKGFRVVSGLRL